MNSTLSLKTGPKRTRDNNNNAFNGMTVVIDVKQALTLARTKTKRKVK